MRIKHWFYTVPLRLRSLFRRARVEQELDEELRYHLERQTEENIAKGMTPDEARYAALRAMGGVERRKEECRDKRRVRLIEDLIQDLRYGLRMLRKSPGFTAVAALSLALGIGANTAIFSVFDPLVIKSLPVEDPDQLVVLNTVDQRGDFRDRFSYPMYEQLRTRTQVFSGLFAESWFARKVEMTGAGTWKRERKCKIEAGFREVFSGFRRKCDPRPNAHSSRQPDARRASGGGVELSFLAAQIRRGCLGHQQGYYVRRPSVRSRRSHGA